MSGTRQLAPEQLCAQCNLFRHAQEAKPYRNDPDVVAMTSLVDAYQRNNINEFEKTLKTNRFPATFISCTCPSSN